MVRRRLIKWIVGGSVFMDNLVLGETVCVASFVCLLSICMIIWNKTFHYIKLYFLIEYSILCECPKNILSFSLISKRNIKIEDTSVDVLQLQFSREVENFDSQPSQVYLNDFFSYIGGEGSKTFIFTRVQIQIKRVFQKYSYCSLIFLVPVKIVHSSELTNNENVQWLKFTL